MKMKIWKSKDFAAGLFFFFCGLAAVAVAGRYKLGMASRMGPGYFPTLLGGLLAALGLFIVARAVWPQREMVKSLDLRPLLLVIGSIVAFAALVQPLGLVAATLVLIVVSCSGGREFHVREVALLCLILVSLAVALFAWGLRIPFKIWPV